MIAWQLRQALFQLPQGDVDRPRQMSSHEFVLGTDIEKGHKAVLHARDELLPRHGLQGITLEEIAVQYPLYLGNVLFRDLPHGRQKADNRLVGKPIKDTFSFSPGYYQPRATQLLKVLGCISDGQTGSVGERFDASLPLSHELQKL